MIKNFTQFNEELSPQLLRRTAVAAYGATNSQGTLNPQTKRGDKFHKAAGDAERESMNSKKRSNYNEFMSLTGGLLFGYECIVDELRVNPGGDTWIEIRSDFETKKGSAFETKKGSATRIFITDDLIKKGKLDIIDTGGTQQTIELNELALERKDARVYAKFLNWWNGAALEELDKIPFSVNDYCIKGLHI